MGYKNQEDYIQYHKKYREGLDSEKVARYMKKWKTENREKHNANCAEWRKGNPGSRKATYLKYEYGLTMESYQQMLGDSGGLCAICKQPFNLDKHEPCVDHDHETNCVRGLLCQQCNKSLGGFNDNVETLLNAVEYLRRN